MGLQYPPGAFAQSLRQRYRALKSTQVLLVVEGASDRKALLPFVTPTTVIISGRGRPNVLDAYSRLSGHGFDRCLYVVDCDNNISHQLKGLPDLVITNHRDTEADVLFDLRGFERIALEYLDDGFASREELNIMRDELLSYVSTLTFTFGMVKDAARSCRIRVRIKDVTSGRKRRLSAADLPSIGRWVAAQHLPSYREIADDIANLLGWGLQDVVSVCNIAASYARVPCRRHREMNCGACLRRMHCNGHDLVAVLAIDLSIRLSMHVSETELDQMMRISVESQFLTRWVVAARIKRWEQLQGLRVLAT